MRYEKQADEDGHLYFHLYTAPRLDMMNERLPHFHNSIELFFVADGEFYVYIEGKETRLEKGDVAFIDRLTPHTGGHTKNSAQIKVYSIVASSAYLTSIGWLENKTLPTYTKSRKGVERIESLIEWAYAEKEAMNKEMRIGFITLLLGLLEGYVGTRERKSERSGRLITDLMIYINESFRKEITLDMLSKKFGYEKTYLSRTFNKYLGMNLREYLNRLRINAALEEKKKSPDTPIYKIARECGFENQNTFYRALNRYKTTNFDSRMKNFEI